MSFQSISKKHFLISVISAAILYLIAHGYRFSNMMFSGDALFEICQDDYAWQIALGRWVHPFLIFLRGSLTNPWLICWMAIIWLSLSVYLITDYLNIRSALGIIICSAVMTCNPIIISLNSAFLPWSDLFALSLFLSISAVYLIDKWISDKKKILLLFSAVVSITLSLGIYQAYICVTVGLVIIKTIAALSKENNLGNVFLDVGIYAGSTAIGGVLYFLIWKIIQKALNIWTANTYNGMADIDGVMGTGLVNAVGSAYKNVFTFLVNPEVFYSLTFRSVNLSIIWLNLFRLCNALVVFGICMIIINNIKKKEYLKCFLQVMLLLLFPLGINIVCVVSQGMQHTLMTYGMLMIYIFTISVYFDEDAFSAFDSKKIRNRKIAASAVCIIPILLLCWNNIVYANQVYLKKALQEEATTALLTRMLSDIEDTENYIAGETPVAIVGDLRNCKSIPVLDNFETIVPYGMGNSLLTYGGTDSYYLKYLLNANIYKIEIPVNNEIKAMPNYPDYGSIKIVDGTVIVKISD
ncbi:MAG: glucosyltransferase domain-containing protein [Lachnospiraceae bacterium]|nr:glucosyltransferase domain-containing protein [Lachnospiraceae bacterium]